MALSPAYEYRPTSRGYLWHIVRRGATRPR